MTTTVPSLSVELVAIDSLHPDSANPRRITDDELESLTRSMRQWGVVQPVLARREDSVVIGGHQRLVAARRMGLTEVPVIWLDISQEQARLLNLALNRISGSWDEQLLARLLADLGSMPDLDLAGATATVAAVAVIGLLVIFTLGGSTIAAGVVTRSLASAHQPHGPGSNR